MRQVGVRESIKPVIENAKFVRINMTAIEGFLSTVRKEEFEQSEIKNIALGPEFSEEQNVAFAFVIGVLQFYFWGNPKWTILLDGQLYDGSAALLRALRRGIAEGYPLCDANYLADLNRADLQNILRGEPDIPLFGDRLRMLRDFGNTVKEKFKGLSSAIIEKNEGDAAGIVTTLADEFPSVFDDTADYHGHTVHFYKRAQLVPEYLYELHQFGFITHAVINTEVLTGLADYKAPQMLRKLGILEYTPSLADRVDRKIEISSGSDEEIEIRAYTIYAEDLVAQALAKQFPDVSARLAHKVIWSRGQTKSPDEKPYHRTRTIAY